MSEEVLRLHNADAQPLEVVLEPWGAVLSLPPDDTFLIRCYDGTSTSWEVEHSREHLVVYGLPRSRVAVERASDGALALDYRSGPPIPPTPPLQE